MLENLPELNWQNIRRATFVTLGIGFGIATAGNGILAFSNWLDKPAAPEDLDKGVDHSEFKAGTFFTDYSAMPMTDYAVKQADSEQYGHHFLYDFKDNRFGVMLRLATSCGRSTCATPWKMRFVTMPIDDATSASLKSHFNDMRARATKTYGASIPQTLAMRLSVANIILSSRGNYWFQDRAHNLGCVLSFSTDPLPQETAENKINWGEQLPKMASGTCRDLPETTAMFAPSKPDYIIKMAPMPALIVPAKDEKKSADTPTAAVLAPRIN